jgi:hypothetical protein
MTTLNITVFISSSLLEKFPLFSSQNFSTVLFFISYLAKTKSLGLRLTANMIDNIALLIILYIIFDSVIVTEFLSTYYFNFALTSSIHDFFELFSFVPVIVYKNAETDKNNILSENKDKAGIYQWTHIESGKIYVGSAVDLAKRIRKYYYPAELKRANNYICNALICHTHSAFSLSVLEYIDISGLSKKDSRKLILEREQSYINKIFSEDQPNTYNILKEAGSSLGFSHSVESLALMSEAKAGENHPNFGKTHSAETKALMSTARGTTIYVYDSESILVNSMTSARKAAIHFSCSKKTIKKYTDSGQLFRDKWILSTTESPASSCS